jgi:phage FluMu gp28-like protein
MSEVGWRPLQRLGSKIGADVRVVDRRVTLRGGGWVQVRSADNPDSLRGEGLDYVVMDECAFTRARAWREALRPALADRQGKALFISTPKGRDWFWHLWLRGQGDDSGWASWTFPTSANPYIETSEVEAARETLPDRIFRQEYLAEFLEDAGAVFRGVTAAATATVTPPEEGHEYVFGVDWAKHVDFTVIAVIDAQTRQMVAMDRFRQIDYRLQVGRLKGLYERYMPGVIVAERNSIGEPLIEELQYDGLPVEGFTTTNATKAQAINGLALAIEKQDLRILNDPDLVGELQAFEPHRLPSGMIRYQAPEDMHDDCVIALALAWHGVEASAGPWALLI